MNRLRTWWGGWLLVVLALMLGPAAVAAERAQEYELKAAMLYHFARFVDWPAQAFAGGGDPIVIGLLGQDVFGPLLDELVRNEVVKGRPVVVQRFRRLEEVGVCHILFISRSEAPNLTRILSALRQRPILTVGETDGFARQGGVVRFITANSKITLRVNLEAARTAHLQISSKLLRAADVISGGARP